MKKLLSVFLVLTMLFLSCSMSATAVSNSDSASTIRKAFKTETDESLYKYDYSYYSPVKGSNDKTKYPLILWLHGQLSGDYSGDQIIESDIAYLATSQNQAKIKGAGGAFILVPRYPTLNVSLAWVGENANIKKLVDGFIAKYKANIDTNRIYVGGYSMGGKASMSFAAAYPNYVAAIFPASSIYLLSSAQSDMRSLVNTPTWFFTCEDDNFWGKPIPQTSDWNYFCSITNQKDNVRWTQFKKTLYNYDGSPILTVGYSEHNVWDPVMHDLIMKNGTMYPNMVTINGNGTKVTLTNDNSFLYWLSSQSLDGPVADDGTTPDDDDSGSSGDVIGGGSSGIVFHSLREILEYIVSLFDRLYKALFTFDY